MAATPRKTLGGFVVAFIVEAIAGATVLAASGSITGSGRGAYYAAIVIAILGGLLLAAVEYAWQRFERPVAPDPGSRRPWPLIVLASNTVATISGWAAHRGALKPGRGRLVWNAVALVSTGGTDIALEFESGDIERWPRWWRPWRLVLLFALGATAVTIVDSLAPPGGGLAAGPVVAIIGGLVVALVGVVFDDLRRIVLPFQGSLGELLGWAALVGALGVGVAAGARAGTLAPKLLEEFATDWGAMVVTFAPVAVALGFLAVSFGLLAVSYSITRVVYPFEEEDDPELRERGARWEG